MHRPVSKTECPDCGTEVVAIEGDDDPVCERCRAARARMELAVAIMQGRMDEHVPGLGVPFDGEEEDD